MRKRQSSDSTRQVNFITVQRHWRWVQKRGGKRFIQPSSVKIRSFGIFSSSNQRISLSRVLRAISGAPCVTRDSPARHRALSCSSGESRINKWAPSMTIDKSADWSCFGWFGQRGSHKNPIRIACENNLGNPSESETPKQWIKWVRPLDVVLSGKLCLCVASTFCACPQHKIRSVCVLVASVSNHASYTKYWSYGRNDSLSVNVKTMIFLFALSRSPSSLTVAPSSSLCYALSHGWICIRIESRRNSPREAD